MKYTIKYREQKVEKLEPTLKFYLEQNSNDMITLRGIDENGIDWNILSIVDGKLWRYRSTASAIEKDNKGRIIVES